MASDTDTELEQAIAELDAARQLMNETDGWDALDPADVDAFVNEYMHEPAVANVFCPTGEGGGIDPRCGKGTPAQRAVIRDAKQKTSAAKVAFVKETTRVVEEYHAWESSTTKKSRSLAEHRVRDAYNRIDHGDSPGEQIKGLNRLYEASNAAANDPRTDPRIRDSMRSLADRVSSSIRIAREYINHKRIARGKPPLEIK